MSNWSKDIDSYLTAEPAPAPVPVAPSKSAFDQDAFAALPLPDKLDQAAHASLEFKMALITGTDPERDDIQKVKAALSAAQTILQGKIRVDEVGFRAAQPDRTAEYMERLAALQTPDYLARLDRIERALTPVAEPDCVEQEAAPTEA